MLSEDAVAQRQARLKRWHKPYTLELTLLVGKKKVHKSAVIRETCKRRFREALKLVVCRGASKSSHGGVELQSGARDGPRKWLLPGERCTCRECPKYCWIADIVTGYSYVGTLTLEMYRHPLPDLLETMRAALSSLKVSG